MRYIPEPKGDIRKLPKWAQEHVEDLKRELARTDAEYNRVSNQHPESNLKLDGKVGYPPVGLPSNASIQFYMGDSREDYKDLFEIRHNRDNSHALEVYGYGGAVVIMPSSSNHIQLVLGQRR
jgi:hypothetical protein